MLYLYFYANINFYQVLRSKKDKETKQTWGGWFGSFWSGNQNKTTDDDSTGKKIGTFLLFEFIQPIYLFNLLISECTKSGNPCY